MRTLAMGDIHGCLTALERLLEIVALQPGDILVTLGDYVDRGPDSCGVIEKLLELEQTGGLGALCGNHELMMLEARHDKRVARGWWTVGGKETLESYGAQNLDEIPAEHWAFLERCHPWWEEEDYIFVHAGLDPDLEMADQPDYLLFWEKFRPVAHFSGKGLICGHTSQKSGLPLNAGHAFCLDTWAYGDGWLSCMDTQSGALWQANQRGEARRGFLDDPGFEVEI